jgi:hypothetical protein
MNSPEQRPKPYLPLALAWVGVGTGFIAWGFGETFNSVAIANMGRVLLVFSLVGLGFAKIRKSEK